MYILESSGKEEDEGSGQEGEDEQTEEEAEIEEDSGIYIYIAKWYMFLGGARGGGLRLANGLNLYKWLLGRKKNCMKKVLKITLSLGKTNLIV